MYCKTRGAKLLPGREACPDCERKSPSQSTDAQKNKTAGLILGFTHGFTGAMLTLILGCIAVMSGLHTEDYFYEWTFLCIASLIPVVSILFGIHYVRQGSCPHCGKSLTVLAIAATNKCKSCNNPILLINNEFQKISS